MSCRALLLLFILPFHFAFAEEWVQAANWLNAKASGKSTSRFETPMLYSHKVKDSAGVEKVYRGIEIFIGAHQMYFLAAEKGQITLFYGAPVNSTNQPAFHLATAMAENEEDYRLPRLMISSETVKAIAVEVKQATGDEIFSAQPTDYFAFHSGAYTVATASVRRPAKANELAQLMHSIHREVSCEDQLTDVLPDSGRT
jgi:GH24 family phage-related lysozyme (muramidase)